MRRPKHHIQRKPPPDGMTPSLEARQVLEYVVSVTQNPVPSHDPSRPPQSGCGPLFASRLLQILRRKDSLPPLEDPDAYRLIAHYKAALHVKMIGKRAMVNPENTTTQECRIIAGLENLNSQWNKGGALPNVKDPYEDFADYAKVAILRPMPWVDGADPELKKATRRTSTKPTPETRRILDTVCEASSSNPNPIPVLPGTSTVRPPDDKRLLQEMYQISTPDLQRRVKNFNADHLPEKLCKDSDGDPITLARPGNEEFIAIYHPSFSVQQLPLPSSPGSEENVRQWVLQSVLQTAQRMLNVIDPSTSTWSFGDVHGRGTQDLKSDFSWQCNLGQGTDVDVTHRLIVEVKAPWVMRTKDFEEFVALGKLRKASEIVADIRAKNNGVIPTDKHGDPEPPTFKKVENYENWVFGVFSLGFEIAYVSGVIPYDNTGPTVLECLMYWVQSAMFVPGLFEVPMVSTTVPPAHKTDTVHTLEHAWFRNPKAVAIIGSLSGSGKILPTAWELAVERWRSHGYERVEAAIEESTKLQAATDSSTDILAKNPQMTALRKFLKSFSPAHRELS
ncbi:hypothetical protein FRC04_007948 [Tulasnella sp. 424]|nr:hypothetical protein FRC04_007948 [Tulasnella sp. 424]